MLLTPYGFREWGIATLIAVLVSIPLVILGQALWLILVWSLWLVVAGFFRDPVRRVPTAVANDPNAMLSPADGTITAVERLDAHEATAGEPAVVIRIFLSVLNVHVNRAPCDATVVDLVYRPGEFLDARRDESAQVNESNLILLERPNGDRLGVRQVSGAIARRIVCPLRPGASITRGERIGMIKFGSTTELILPRPDAVTVKVEPGDAVRGVRTVLAEVRNR
ncbi:MAG: phosphatidylserine decarboxylase [Phycisphaerales bacterium]